MSGLSKVVLICTSPKAGSGKRRDLIPKIRDALIPHGYKAEVTSDIQQLAELATKHTEDGNLTAVIAAGGDGTLSLVASNVPHQTPLLPVPLGTENLMARYLGHTTSVSQIVETICQGKFITMDAGMANDRLFLIMFSCGFDAEVVRQLHNSRRGHIWKISYLLPTIRAVSGYRYPKVLIDVEDGDAETSTARWAFVFNAPRYAMGLPIAHWSDPGDGALDLVTFQRGSFISTLRYFFRVLCRSHPNHSDTHVAKRSRLSLSSETPMQVPYQLDGDFAGYLPVKLSVLPGRICMLVPPNLNAIHESSELATDDSKQGAAALAVT